MGLFGNGKQTVTRGNDPRDAMEKGLARDVLLLLDEMETGKPKRASAAKATLSDMGEEALDPLSQLCSFSGLLSAVDAMMAIGPAKAVHFVDAGISAHTLTEALGTHVLARLALAKAPRALKAVQRASHQGEESSADAYYAGLDANVVSVPGRGVPA